MNAAAMRAGRIRGKPRFFVADENADWISDPFDTRETRPTCVELFAGAGGLMLGLELAGFRTIVANEVHADPCKTLAQNFPGTPIAQGSVTDFRGKDLRSASGLASGAEVDVVAGGPPCQGFSTAGMKDPVDPRNTLVGEFIRIVREIRPRFFVLENVTGMVTMFGGRLFANVLAMLEELGYTFEHRILFAAEHGVPQMRKRLIVLGARDEPLPDFPAPGFRSPTDLSLLNQELPVYTNCGDALGDLPAIGPGETATSYWAEPQTPYQRYMRGGSTGLYNHEAGRHKPETMEYYALVPPGGTWLDIPEHQRKKKQGMQRWPLDGLARTVTSEPTDFLHPTLDRIPTVRELARIQSFPDWFIFRGQRTTGNRMRRLGYCSQTQQVGNAVPPLLAMAVGLMIREACLGRLTLEARGVRP